MIFKYTIATALLVGVAAYFTRSLRRSLDAIGDRQGVIEDKLDAALEIFGEPEVLAAAIDARRQKRSQPELSNKFAAALVRHTALVLISQMEEGTLREDFTKVAAWLANPVGPPPDIRPPAPREAPQVEERQRCEACDGSGQVFIRRQTRPGEPPKHSHLPGTTDGVLLPCVNCLGTGYVPRV